MQSMPSQEVDDSWSFKDLSRFQTSYIIHDYHRYPTKFISHLASRIIKENSDVGILVCDPSKLWETCPNLRMSQYL